MSRARKAARAARAARGARLHKAGQTFEVRDRKGTMPREITFAGDSLTVYSDPMPRDLPPLGPELTGLLSTFVSDPCEFTQGILADWLEGHGDERHAAVRAHRIHEHPAPTHFWYVEWPEGEWAIRHRTLEAARGEFCCRVLALFGNADDMVDLWNTALTKHTSA